MNQQNQIIVKTIQRDEPNTHELPNEWTYILDPNKYYVLLRVIYSGDNMAFEQKEFDTAEERDEFLRRVR